MRGAPPLHLLTLSALALLAAATDCGERSEAPVPTARTEARASAERPAATAKAATPAEAQRVAVNARDDRLPDGVGAVDLAARLTAMEREKPMATDRSETFLAVPEATVHMHLMGYEQMTPLHVHRSEDEATIIVSGEAQVLQIFGRGGERATREGVYRPGELISSPAWCGHEWVNPHADRMQGNLVFAVPPFHGNLHLRPDDPRLLQGGEPFVYDPHAELAAFAASGEDFRVTRLPILGGAMSSLLLNGEYVVEPSPQGATVGYVAAGTVLLEGYGEMGPAHLLLFNASSPVVVRARGNAPAALYLFDPHGAHERRNADG